MALRLALAAACVAGAHGLPHTRDPVAAAGPLNVRDYGEPAPALLVTASVLAWGREPPCPALLTDR